MKGAASFHDGLHVNCSDRSFDIVVGFNRISGIDVYYAADPCYIAKIHELHGPLYRLSGRYRYFSAVEKELFGPGSDTRILLLSEQEISKYVAVLQHAAATFHRAAAGHLARAACPAGCRAAYVSDFRREYWHR